jgi:hypothetical protein
MYLYGSRIYIDRCSKFKTHSNYGIDTMNISSTLKAKFHTAISEGDTIYTPTAPFTRGNWTGMVYITLDATTGAGSYVIGEGLNGGYTVETPD